MDNNFNNNEFNNVYNTESAAHEQTTPEQSGKKPQKKHKDNLTLKVAAMMMAVIVVGGGAGFGGAYIAGKANNSAAFAADQNTSEFTLGAAGENVSATPTLNDLQKDVSSPSTMSNTDNGKIEFNSDGTYKYTRDLVRAVQDSVVYIEVFTDYYGKKTQVGSASGVIISENGYVVTNNHVVESSTSYTVKVNSTDSKGAVTSKTYDAKLLGTDKDTDLAVLKIEGKGLPAAKLGDSDTLHLGDDLVVIGNPMGLETSVSTGVVSGLNRQINDSARSLSSIQTDAAINSGNSGGALFNGCGEVVGIVNEKLVNDYAESLGFGITINEAKSVIEDLISNGYVTGRAIIGITYNEVTEAVAMFRGMIAGWQVASINQDLPVANSGLVVGDTITAIDGESVFDGSAAAVLAKKNPGDTIKLTVVRTDSLGRQTNTDITVELAEYKGN